MSDKTFSIRTRRFLRNPLLKRKQFVVDVLHPNRANVSKEELKEKIAKLYKSKPELLSLFDFRTHFGGGKSTGFGLLYDDIKAMYDFEPGFRLVRAGRKPAPKQTSRKQIKEKKNREKKYRGTRKVKKCGAMRKNKDE
eukprot:TRINITY_DN15906_c0_g1_i1.p2 TRINITY_DN15906_c0_g1~~TRINITY_DN15906_c0_g1_i1.p2  ORF type:complete len:145 (-),score=36.96 TRINITY_DN15906_c0_g1_i1:157-570(-)